MDDSMICHVCGKEFMSKLGNLRKHLKDKHNIIENIKYNVKCLEPDCSFTCCKLENLRIHLETNHEITQDVDEFEFENMEEFRRWKAAEESRCVAFWVKSGGTRKKNGQAIYYYCNRSGKKRVLPNEERKRLLKSQGSCKTDYSCTSAIIVRNVREGIRVRYYKSHYGHDNKLAHVPVSTDAKNMIASQLIQGVPHNEILNTISESEDLSIERHKQLRRIIKLERGKVLNKIRQIDSSHTTAENEQDMSVIKFENVWQVVSENTIYFITINTMEENHMCKLQCTTCLFCIHIFCCTCRDYVINDNMCKHIHKVCISESSEKINEEIQNYRIQTNEEETIDLNNLNGPIINAIQARIRTNINNILTSGWANVTDQISLNKINAHLTSALNLIASNQKATIIKIFSVDTKIEGQVRHESTKRVAVPLRPLLPKPTLEVTPQVKVEVTPQVKVDVTPQVKVGKTPKLQKFILVRPNILTKVAEVKKV